MSGDTGSCSLCVPIVVIGSPSSGKSSLVQKFMFDEVIPENIKRTCHHGVVYYSKTVVYDSFHYKFKIWDTSGDDRYQFLLPMYYKSANVAIVTYAPDKDQESFQEALKIIGKLKAEQNIKLIALVATKMDLGSVLSPAEVQEFLKALPNTRGIIISEISNMEGTSVVNLFEQIAMTCKGDKDNNFISGEHHVLGVNSLFSTTTDESDENIKIFQNSVELANHNVFKQDVESIYMYDIEYHAPPTPNINVDEDELDSDTEGSDLKAKRPEWIKDEFVKSCYKCGTTFSVFVRKHHCRACGKIFCSNCSSHFTTIPYIAYNKPVRVCNDCHKRLMH